MDNVIKTLDHLAFLPPRSLVLFDSVTLNISGDKAYNQGDLVEAIREYERAVLLDPTNTNALNSLGVAYAHQGRLEDAVVAFERVRGQAPEDFMASFNLGFALARLGRCEEAVREWEGLAERSTPDFDLYFHLASLYRDQKAYHKAYEWFRRAEGAPNKKGFIYRHLGETEELLGKGKEAMSWYKKALKHQPQNAFCLNRLGALYLDQGESIRVALSLCQQAVRIEPSKGAYWLTLGQALLANRQPKKALEAFQKAMDLGAPLKEVYRLSGLTCRTLGRHQEARDFFYPCFKTGSAGPGFAKNSWRLTGKVESVGYSPAQSRRDVRDSPGNTKEGINPFSFWLLLPAARSFLRPYRRPIWVGLLGTQPPSALYKPPASLDKR